MPIRALVVDDDRAMAEAVADILASLGHDHDSASNQEDARRLVRRIAYDYVLLELEIPARPRSPVARIQNGENLLEEIRASEPNARTPVIIITSYGKEGPDIVVEVMQKGATDYVTKPFASRGKTLDKAIKRALGHRQADTPEPRRAAEAQDPAPGAQRRSAGGILTLYPDRAELNGVVIVTDRGHGHSLKVLELLAEKRPDGLFVRRSARDIARALGGSVGDGQITGCARRIRRSVRDELREQLGLECDPHRDFLIRDRQGYHLNERISVERPGSAQVEGTSPDVPSKHVPASDVPPTAPHVPATDVPASDVPPTAPDVPATHSPLNERQEWVLRELRKGATVRRTTLQEHFGVADKTAKRDLSGLRERGLVEYVREGHGGYYRLPQP